MRSRGNAEHLLRLVVLVVLAGYLTYVLRQRRGGYAHATSATLHAALARWSTAASPARVHVDLTSPPNGAERDWLAALGGASTLVHWSGPSLLPTAISEEPRVDPAGGADVSVAAPLGAVVRLADTLGGLDSARATGAGVHAILPRPRSSVDAVVGAVVARAARHDSLDLGRLLVIGAASWETKFTMAALEERGWTVDAEIPLSPKSVVRQGTATTIDTSRYSAVLALDSTAAPFGDRIVRFVRTGGGAVLWATATKAPSLAAIAPGRAGDAIEDEEAVPSDTAPRQALELVGITALLPDAVVLERRGDAVSVAARRIGLGRVIETGYTTSWRWRMAGGDDAPDRHRDWLAGLVAGVAYTGRHTIAAPPTDVAPLASLIDHLGPAVVTGNAGNLDPERVARWVFAVLVGALLLEWASRRTRGVK